MKNLTKCFGLTLLIWLTLNTFIFSLETLKKNQPKITRGPLKISADETTSTDKGKMIEAHGNVHIRYELESEDILVSNSNFARYNEQESLGELTGNPKATWFRKDPLQPSTFLTAETILLKIKDEGLIARGNVKVIQASSTLTAQEIIFSNPDKKLIAQGEKPKFNVLEKDHHTLIEADKITAWTEKREIEFNGKVEGTVFLNQK
ncbi:MAG: hypothetical protein A3I11_04365 [Elusimicrobia bacterium RIFCSPLOWO2_02_FULL_39_32]|nr:MAG: hypothetical protein A2034_04885 [Elusimicrobia bacterium GWA2_38_7]OGR79603.1 MAG: hypothetical protein A3B80_02935 [Elusimicrobia bacterium RIFCSPHIGHO2_02_FULL_39_36]OGR92930.1 MAG: hypothetical protein A3I11_04365 [Elusimicrobia bacterium RIFCSPLOWO2_02_FULL_39_32]OGR99713.1 MAG: hypothetical protein A3G85_01725 [Elusimicrobia bacterium RIFCSPLOWO2_12_FULL_39_28]